MKKNDYVAGLTFLAIAVIFTVASVWHIIRNKEIEGTLVKVAIYFWILTAAYSYFTVQIRKKQREKIIDLTIAYMMLLDMYENIKNPENQQNELLNYLFISGVHDFGCVVFDILVSTYPKEMKEHAEHMLNQLMMFLAELMRDKNPPDTIERS